MLALMALVRLHKLKLLNNNLLPLKRKDLLNVVYSKVLPKLHPAPVPPSRIMPPTSSEMSTRVYIYSVLQSGEYFDQHDKVLKGLKRHLGICSTEALPAIRSFSFDHSELGLVSCHLGKQREVKMNDEE
eukprot:3998247-Ditylum_brightwellii.AAC.1